MLPRLLALAAPLWLSMGVVVSAFPPISEADWQRLFRGEVVVHSERDGADGAYVVTISGLYLEPPDVVWDVVADCARFHEFMPRMSESEVTRDAEGRLVCRTVSDLPLPLPDLEAAVHTWSERRADGTRERHFRLLPGDSSYLRNEGVWRVSPHEGRGGRTLLRYRLAVVPRISVPKFIVQAAQRTTAPESFEAIRTEAHKRRPGEVSAAPEAWGR